MVAGCSIGTLLTVSWEAMVYAGLVGLVVGIAIGVWGGRRL